MQGLYIRNYDSAILEAWAQGVEHFNAGRFWHAHECWERGWKGLPEPERTWVQACIQIAGMLHLQSRGRDAPAAALRRLAQAKFGAAQSMLQVVPRIEIDGAAQCGERPVGLRARMVSE